MATVGDIVAQYKKVIREFPDYKGRIYVNIDDTGVGGGVTDTNEGKEAAEHYNNLTTHMWAVLRDLLRNKQIEIGDEADTFAQLSVRKYFMASNGKLELESKKEMKKRGVASPDRADALALSTYLGKIKKYTGSAPSSDAINGLNKSSYWT